MAKFSMPPADVLILEVDQVTGKFTGRFTNDFYDTLKALEKLRFLDLADVSTTVPTNGQVAIYNSTTKTWVPGAN